MRKNQYDELMRIQEIRLQPIDIANPIGEWKMDILWLSQHPLSGKWYDGLSETLLVGDAIRRGIVTMEQMQNTYMFHATIADNWYKSTPQVVVEPDPEVTEPEVTEPDPEIPTEPIP